MKKTIIATMAITPALAGCYPMEQAPLVYASKSTIGVNITGGTTDNPGIDLVVGYKASDIALVPVAAAKHCRSTIAGACDSDLYRMTVIGGNKRDASSNGDLEIEITNAKLDADEKYNRVQALSGEKQNLLARQALATNRDALLTAAAELGEETDGEEAAIQSRRNELATKLAAEAYQGLPDTEEITGEIAVKQEEIEAANRDYGRSSEHLADLRAQLRSESSANREDSLSVYGTFGGTGNAQPGQGQAYSAGIAGDKVFATGIAAQNLSDHRGATDCLAAINRLALSLPADAAERKQLIGGAAEVCKKPAHD